MNEFGEEGKVDSHQWSRRIKNAWPKLLAEVSKHANSSQERSTPTESRRELAAALRRGVDPDVLIDAVAAGLLKWVGLQDETRRSDVAVNNGHDMLRAVLVTASQSFNGVRLTGKECRRSTSPIVLVGSPCHSVMTELSRAGYDGRVVRAKTTSAREVAATALSHNAATVFVSSDQSSGPCMDREEIGKLVRSLGDLRRRPPTVVVDCRDGRLPETLREVRGHVRSALGSAKFALLGAAENTSARFDQLFFSVHDEAGAARAVRRFIDKRQGFDQRQMLITALAVLGHDRPRGLGALLRKQAGDTPIPPVVRTHDWASKWANENAQSSIHALKLEFDARNGAFFHPHAYTNEWERWWHVRDERSIKTGLADAMRSLLDFTDYPVDLVPVFNTPTSAMEAVFGEVLSRGGGVKSVAHLNPLDFEVTDLAMETGFDEASTVAMTSENFDMAASIDLIRSKRPALAILKTPFNLFGDRAEGLKTLADACGDETVLMIENTDGVFSLADGPRNQEVSELLEDSKANVVVVAKAPTWVDAPEADVSNLDYESTGLSVVFTSKRFRELSGTEWSIQGDEIELSSARRVVAFAHSFVNQGLRRVVEASIKSQMPIRDTVCRGAKIKQWTYNPQKSTVSPGCGRPDWSGVGAAASGEPIVVVGGGPVGLNIALELAQKGRRVKVYDNTDGAFRTSGGQHILLIRDYNDRLPLLTEAGMPTFSALSEIEGSGVTERTYVEPYAEMWNADNKRLMDTRRVGLRSPIQIQSSGRSEVYKRAVTFKSFAIDPIRMCEYLREVLTEKYGVEIIERHVTPQDIRDGFGAGQPVMTVVAAGTKTPELLGYEQSSMLDGHKSSRWGGISFVVTSERPLPPMSVSAGDYLINVLDPHTVKVGGLYIENPPEGSWHPTIEQVEYLRSGAVELLAELRAKAKGDYEFISPDVLKGPIREVRGDSRLVVDRGPLVLGHPEAVTHMPDGTYSSKVVGICGHGAEGLVLAPGTAKAVAPLVKTDHFAYSTAEISIPHESWISPR